MTKRNSKNHSSNETEELLTIPLNQSERRIFLDDQISFKPVNFIYGPNGTGKSTLAEYIKCYFDNPDGSNCRIFDGYEGILGDNQKLNAVVLGEENTEIDKKVELLNSEIQNLQKKIEEINRAIVDPRDGSQNLWTEWNDANNDVERKERNIDKIYTESAKSIKELDNPRIASLIYNKKDFEKDIKRAAHLSDDEKKQYQETAKTGKRQASEIIQISINGKELLDKVNKLREKFVQEQIVIQRIDCSEKREFARKGLELHKAGDVCAFCGHVIEEATIGELKSYFDADDVRAFQAEISGIENDINRKIKVLEQIQVKSQEFYPKYSNEALRLCNAINTLVKEYENFLENLRAGVQEKERDIYKPMVDIDAGIPSDLTNLVKRYNSLVRENNASDLNKDIELAKEKLRLDYVYDKLKESHYKEKEEELNIARALREEKHKPIEKKKKERDELEKKIEQKEDDIKNLEAKTKNEKILAEHINKKLSTIVNFELVHIEDQSVANGEGYYNIRDKSTNVIRDITQLSTGEHNVIAILYFIEELRNIIKDNINQKRVIVFDDPVTSNDDFFQFLIMEELNSLIGFIKAQESKDVLVVMTHNAHFYIDLNYGYRGYGSRQRIRFLPGTEGTTIKIIKKPDDDIKTNYDALWGDFRFLCETLPDNKSYLLMNIARCIIETYTNFNRIKEEDFLEKVDGLKKMLNVNSHSRNDIFMDSGLYTIENIKDLLKECFVQNDAADHFDKHWNSTDSIVEY